jgi:hypothetical protein
MGSLDQMLDELKIRHIKKPKEGNSITYLCMIDKEGAEGFPLRIILNEENNVLGFYSGRVIPIESEMRSTVYPILNELNGLYAFGTYYLDKKDRVQHYIGVSMEGDEPKLSINQLYDYIRSIEVAHGELVGKLVEANAICVDDKGDSVKSE